MEKHEFFFNEIASSLDLTIEQENTLIKKYNELSDFLVNCANLSVYNPDIFYQGSVRLGTVVRPLKHDDYDLDIVCRLDSSCLPAKTVKHLVGDALKISSFSKHLEEEHGRCWTLRYLESPPYHIDVLPGLLIANDRVKATNKNNLGIYQWLYTNPKGFADWFLNIGTHSKILLEHAEIEQLNLYKRRNILQRAVQIIKRHRDVYFKDNEDDGPASVIITALTGLAYQNETSIRDILINGPIKWVSYIKHKDGKYSIKIPTLPDDDYADKWNEDDPLAVDRFLEWHRQLLLDLDALFNSDSVEKFIRRSQKMFLESTVDKVLNENQAIKHSLHESYAYTGVLIPMNKTHSLYKHANIWPRGVDYVGNSNVKINIICRIYDYDEHQGRIYRDCMFDKYTDILEKKLNLMFEASVKKPFGLKYYIVWQISNTGSEAYPNNLRGEFIYPKSGGYGRFHEETTSYSGTHFVQAFIIDMSTNNCIAKSNIITVNIGED